MINPTKKLNFNYMFKTKNKKSQQSFIYKVRFRYRDALITFSENFCKIIINCYTRTEQKEKEFIEKTNKYFLKELKAIGYSDVIKVVL